MNPIELLQRFPQNPFAMLEMQDSMLPSTLAELDLNGSKRSQSHFASSESLRTVKLRNPGIFRSNVITAPHLKHPVPRMALQLGMEVSTWDVGSSAQNDNIP